MNREPDGAVHLVVDGSGLQRPDAGMGVFTRELTSALVSVRPRHRVSVLAPPGAPLPPTVQRIPASGRRLAGRHLIDAAAVRASRPSAWYGAAGLAPLLPVGAPSVLAVHDVAIYLHPEWFPGGQWFSRRVVVPRSLRGASRLLAVSESTATDVVRVFPGVAGKVAVVPEGVSTRFQPMDRSATEAVRDRFDLPPEFLLFVSTIEPRKNLDLLIDVVEADPSLPPLVVVGAFGWRHEAVRDRLARAGDRIRLLGGLPASDLPALYNLSLCLLHPAWYEGFGLTPLEAMACGTPVVCSNTSSLPEVVGDAALTCDPAAPDRWLEAVRQVATDPQLRAGLRAAGIARASRFRWEATAEATWREIEALL